MAYILPERLPALSLTPARSVLDFESFAGQGQMLDGQVLGASQVEYKPFGKPPLKREGPVFFRSSVFVLRRVKGEGGPVSFRVFVERASLQSTLLCRARFFAEHASLQSTLLCRARFFAEHASLQSTLLCRARFFAEHCPLSFAEHTSLQSTLLCRALSFARSFAARCPLQLLCRAHFFAEQSTLLCRAHFFAEHALQTCFRAVKGEGGPVSFGVGSVRRLFLF